MPKHTRPRLPKAGSSRHTGSKFSLLLLLPLLLTSVLVATGCGETSGSAAGASSTTTQRTPPTSTAAASSTTPGAPGTSSAKAGARVPAGGSSKSHVVGAPARRSRAHLVLPPPGSHPEPKLTASERASVPVADILLSSPAIKRVASSSAYTLDRQYTCHGGDHTPPLRWSGVPANTRELALFVISTRPVNGKLFFDWSLANLKPTLKGLSAGVLPAGAVVGENGFGRTAYSICPSGANHESYVFVLYALPESLAPKNGFDPASLRHQAMQLARHTGLLVGSYG
jgi:phosphatidylethanolamine-binding protein (PEBP) family uncharacterized protein